MSSDSLLAVIPARGGSKGLPRKNVLELAGLPLIAHSIEFARMCPQIDRCILSTDDEEIASIARRHGGDVPFMRPAELALDDSPTWPVLKHALLTVERMEAARYTSILLLEPTSPARLPEDLDRAIALLHSDLDVQGVISVSEMPHHPEHVCVREREGYVVPAFPISKKSDRRQDLEPTFFINGLLFLFKREFLLQADGLQLGTARHLMLATDVTRAIDIDDRSAFESTNILLRSGFIKLPWVYLRPSLQAVCPK